MKRYNQVILDGQMSLRRIYAIRGALALEAVLTTDLAVLGGRHRVVCENELALETLGFLLAGRAHREAGLQATVHGWLWSGGERAHVVAREVVFHVPPQLREQAVNAIKQLRKAGGLPETLAVNGWRVDVREILADVEIGGAPV